MNKLLTIYITYHKDHAYLLDNNRRNYDSLKKYFTNDENRDKWDYVVHPQSEDGLLVDRLRCIKECETPYIMFMDIDDPLYAQFNKICKTLSTVEPDLYSIKMYSMDKRNVWNAWGSQEGVSCRTILNDMINNGRLEEVNSNALIIKTSLLKHMDEFVNFENELRGIHYGDDIFIFYYLLKCNLDKTFRITWDDSSYVLYNQFAGLSYKSTEDWKREGKSIAEDIVIQSKKYFHWFNGKGLNDAAHFFRDMQLAQFTLKPANMYLREYFISLLNTYYSNTGLSVMWANENPYSDEPIVELPKVLHPRLKIYILYGDRHECFIRQCSRNLDALKKYRSDGSVSWDYEFVRNSGKGVLVDRVTCIDKDDSEYFMFLDADDYYFGDFDELLKELMDNKTDIIGCISYDQYDNIEPFNTTGYRDLPYDKKFDLFLSGNEGCNLVGNMIRRDIIKHKIPLLKHDLNGVFYYDDAFIMALIWKLYKGEEGSPVIEILAKNFIMGNSFSGSSYLGRDEWNKEKFTWLISQAKEYYAYILKTFPNDVKLLAGMVIYTLGWYYNCERDDEMRGKNFKLYRDILKEYFPSNVFTELQQYVPNGWMERFEVEKLYE